MPERRSSITVLRKEMVAIGRRLYERGLIVAAEGNLSVRLNDRRILITPRGVCKGRMRAEELVVVDAEGRKLQGRHSPSSELPLHLTALACRPDIGACVHAHPPYATAFAVAGIPLSESVLPEVITTLGSIPLACYATPSTAAVGASIRDHIGQHDAILLTNHGVLTVGPDLESAFRSMEIVERCAQVVTLARQLGRVETLSVEQVEELMTLRSGASPERDPHRRG